MARHGLTRLLETDETRFLHQQLEVWLLFLGIASTIPAGDHVKLNKYVNQRTHKILQVTVMMLTCILWRKRCPIKKGRVTPIDAADKINRNPFP